MFHVDSNTGINDATGIGDAVNPPLGGGPSEALLREAGSSRGGDSGRLAVVVVGAGRMGREHAEAILSLGDAVVAFLDTDISRAKLAAQELGGEAVAVRADIAAALERFARVDGAAVLVASPSALHLPHAQAALSLGFPVLLEKPPWVPGQDPGALLSLESNGAVLAVGMSTRFNPGVQAVRTAVRSGSLGTILLASDRVAFTVPPGTLAEWYFDADQSGGGVLVTNGVHSLDRLAWILGQPLELNKVQLSSEMLGGCENIAVLELSAGQTGVSVLELWGPGPAPQSELFVLGTRGCCWTDAAGNWQLACLDGDDSGTRPPGYSELVEQWRAFRSLATNGAEDGDGMLAGIEELVAPMQLIEQALRS